MRTIFEKSAFEIYVKFEHGKIMQISSVIDSKNVQRYLRRAIYRVSQKSTPV